MTTVYYAHSMRIYGSRRERQELQLLRSHYDRVINPSTDVRTSGSSMAPFLAAVRAADRVVFSTYRGHVGRGVYAELFEAFNHRKPVYLLHSDQLYRIRSRQLRLRDPDDWAVRYGYINMPSGKI